MSQSFEIGLNPEKSFIVDLELINPTDNYNDLKNIPTLNGVEIKGGLSSSNLGLVGKNEIPNPEEIAKKSDIPDVSDFATKVDLEDKQDKGDYALKSQLPTKTSQLTNDSDFVSTSELPEIPTKLSAFENDVGYLTEHQEMEDYAKKTDIPTKLSAFDNDMGYLTQHQDISNLATKAELNNKADKTDIPTKTSQLVNDNVYSKSEIDSMIGDVETAIREL